MGPFGANTEAVAEQLNGGGVVGASDVDHPAAQRLVKVQRPTFRELTARRSSLCTDCSSTTLCSNVRVRATLECQQRDVVEPVPHLRLPVAVVALDGTLEARLPWRNEDRNDPEAEAQPRDASEGVTVVMGTLEARVVIELRVSGKPHLAPMLDEKSHRVACGNTGGRP